MNLTKQILLVCLIGILSACTLPPIPEQKMRASDAVYNQIQKEYFLKNKIAISKIESHIASDRMRVRYDNATLAAQNSLEKAGLLAADDKKASYVLSGAIKDVAVPSCSFGTCEVGSAIEYTLIDKNTGKTVYQELLVVPYSYDYPVFGANMAVVITEAMAGAIGNNFAHLIHVLTEKKKKNLL